MLIKKRLISHQYLIAGHCSGIFRCSISDLSPTDLPPFQPLLWCLRHTFFTPYFCLSSIKPDNFFHYVNLSTNISQSVYFIYIYLSIYLSSSPLLLVSIMLHMNRILIFSVFQQCHTHFHNNNNNIVNRNLRALHVSSKIFLLIFSETK